MPPSSRFGDIRACVFDAYGTLFDVHSAMEPYRRRLGGDAEGFSELWRTRQLEYTWLRAVMDRHADFWQVTQDALDFAMDSYGLSDEELRGGLLEAYLHLACCDDAAEALHRLRAGGCETAVLSNGSPDMLTAALDSSGLRELIDHVWSVEEVGVFKPDPMVYHLPVDKLQLEPSQIAMVSANGWDAAGAAATGLFAIWINRRAARRERLPHRPDAELTALTELPALLGR